MQICINIYDWKAFIIKQSESDEPESDINGRNKTGTHSYML